MRSLARTFPSIGGHLAVLDGLRGIALLLVLFSHASLIGIDMLPGVDMSGVGKTGVWLFFVLSSFLLMHQFLDLDAGGRLGARAFWRYAVRRVLRIYPLYAVFLVVCWLTPLKTYFDSMDGVDVLAHLAAIEGMWHTWSVAVELKYYVLLPLLVLAYLHVARRRFWPATLLAASGIGIREWTSAYYQADGLWTYIAIFLTGSWVAIAHRHLLRRGRMPSRAMQWLAGIAAAAVFTLLMAMTPSLWSRLTGVATPIGHWHSSFTLFALLWSAFLLAILHAPGLLQACFSWLPLRVIGVVSFSAYLWHGLLLANLGWLPFAAGSPAQGAVLFVVVVLTSTLSYLVIEQPFLGIARGHGRPEPQGDRVVIRVGDPAD
ncbi:MAG: acyltransferase family protein [Luteimonas sp.]